MDTETELFDDRFYILVKKTYLEVDQALKLDLSAGGPSIQLRQNNLRAGRATLYLMLLGDERRNQLTFDQVFSLYLIDLCDVCQ